MQVCGQAHHSSMQWGVKQHPKRSVGKNAAVLRFWSRAAESAVCNGRARGRGGESEPDIRLGSTWARTRSPGPPTCSVRQALSLKAKQRS